MLNARLFSSRWNSVTQRDELCSSDLKVRRRMIAELRLSRLLFDRVVLTGTQFFDGQLFMHEDWTPTRFAEELAIDEGGDKSPIEVRVLGGTVEREMLSWVKKPGKPWAEPFVFSVFKDHALRNAIARLLANTSADTLTTFDDIVPVLERAEHELGFRGGVYAVIRRWDDWRQSGCLCVKPVTTSETPWSSETASREIELLQARLKADYASKGAIPDRAKSFIESTLELVGQSSDPGKIRRSEIDSLYRTVTSSTNVGEEIRFIKYARDVVYREIDASRAIQHHCVFSPTPTTACLDDRRSSWDQAVAEKVEQDPSRRATVCTQFMEYMGSASASEFQNIVKESSDARGELLKELKSGKMPSVSQYRQLLKPAVKSAEKFSSSGADDGVRLVIFLSSMAGPMIGTGAVFGLLGYVCGDASIAEQYATGNITSVIAGSGIGSLVGYGLSELMKEVVVISNTKAITTSVVSSLMAPRKPGR